MPFSKNHLGSGVDPVLDIASSAKKQTSVFRDGRDPLEVYRDGFHSHGGPQRHLEDDASVIRTSMNGLMSAE